MILLMQLPTICKKFAASLVVVVLISFFFLSQPVGFDLFYHLYYLQSFSLYNELNQPHTFFGIEVQRYMAFPYIVFLHENVKPLFIILPIQVLAWLAPSIWILKSTKSLSGLIALVVLLMFNLFWTPLSISVGLAASYVISKKPYSPLYLIASLLFHPVSILISIFAILIVRSGGLANKIFAMLCCIAFYIIVCVYLSFYLNKNNSFKTSSDVAEPWRSQSLNRTVSEPATGTDLYSKNSKITEPMCNSGVFDKSCLSNDVSITHSLKTPIRDTISVSDNLYIVFKKSKEIIAAFLILWILSKRFFPVVYIPRFFSITVVSLPAVFFVYKTVSNGSILGSFFIKPVDGAYYDYSVFLALNSYSDKNVNIALSNGFNNCFYSYRKFALAGNNSQFTDFLPLSCYTPQFSNYVVPFSLASKCLRLIKSIPDSKDSDLRFYLNRDGYVFYSMINSYIPDYNSVRHLNTLCRMIPGSND